MKLDISNVKLKEKYYVKENLNLNNVSFKQRKLLERIGESPIVILGFSTWRNDKTKAAYAIKILDTGEIVNIRHGIFGTDHWCILTEEHIKEYLCFDDSDFIFEDDVDDSVFEETPNKKNFVVCTQNKKENKYHYHEPMTEKDARLLAISQKKNAADQDNILIYILKIVESIEVEYKVNKL
ncbi:hypothetical protein AVV36_gp223 [Pectobacterium bacteriophage PM2]|uniref:Uncharacterized protein n=1 Tax=Pectobacterium bacteriophage PM2 TaxID=1429794 RepID=A0A0A0Q3K9_9CAUD|nr:hypothetical protein AVV36_gp223 [Pectobacterium bacteriophage PM2]AHY25187.1 hypothetical protein PM2_225 [Pectobacterium bacteriophage PM2]